MQTGLPIECLRTVLVAKDRKTYSAISEGVTSSLLKIFAIVGQPTWEKGIKVVCKQVTTKKGFNVLTLELQK